MVAAAQGTLFACRVFLGKDETLKFLMAGPDGTPNSLPIAHVYLLASVYDGEELHPLMRVFLPRISAQLRNAPQGEARALLELMNLLDDGTRDDCDLVLAKANAFPREPGVQIQAWKWLLARGDDRIRLLMPRLAPVSWQNCYDASLDIPPDPRTANALVEAWKLNIETNTFHNHETILRNLAKAAGGDAAIVQRLRDLAPASSPKNARLGAAQAAWFITHDRQPLLRFLEDELAGKYPSVCNEYHFNQHCLDALADLGAHGRRLAARYPQAVDDFIHPDGGLPGACLSYFEITGQIKPQFEHHLQERLGHTPPDWFVLEDELPPLGPLGASFLPIPHDQLKNTYNRCLYWLAAIGPHPEAMKTLRKLNAEPGDHHDCGWFALANWAVLHDNKIAIQTLASLLSKQDGQEIYAGTLLKTMGRDAAGALPALRQWRTSPNRARSQLADAAIKAITADLHAPVELEKYWANLGAADPAVAASAFWHLVDAREAGAHFIGKKLTAPCPDNVSYGAFLRSQERAKMILQWHAVPMP